MSVQEAKWVVKVFISSTFNDMHDERDVLMKKVLPRVRQALSSKGLDVRFVDLRWGVNSKEMDERSRESDVLKECLGQIDKCRNFFIGLVGDHYGWIPPEPSWYNLLDGLDEKRKDFIKRKLPNPVSVTELEIYYGSLVDLAFSMRSLFCFRKPEVYETMDETSRSIYVDSGEDRNRVLKLKNDIEKDLKAKRLKTHIYTYPCQWDEKNKKITSLDDFENFIVDFLVKEIPLYEFRQSENLVSDDFSLIRQQDNNDVLVYGQGFWGRNKLLLRLEDIFYPGLKPLLFSSSEGVGKSALLSVIHFKVNNDPKVLSLVAFGRRTQSLSSILKKWISDPALEYDKKFDINENISPEELIWHLHKAIEKSDKFVIILIDDIDWLDRLDLLPLLLDFPVYTGFISTCDEKGLNRMMGFEELKTIWLEGMEEQETRELIGIQLKQVFGKDPFSLVSDEIINSHYKNYKGYENVLWTRLMIQRLLFFTGSEIRDIRKTNPDAGVEELEEFFCSVVKSGGEVLPFSINNLLKDVVTLIGNNNLGFTILSVLALAHYGVKRSVIGKILNIEWDELIFTRSLERFGILLDISEEGVITFRYDIVKSIILDHLNDTSVLLDCMLKVYKTILKEEKDKDALREFPFLCLKAGPQKGGAVMLELDECYEEEYILPAIIYVFSTNENVIEGWIVYLINKKDDSRAFSLLSSLMERLLRENNEDILSHILTIIDEKGLSAHNSALEFICNVCKRKLGNDDLDSVDFPDLNYMWWKERADLIKTRQLIDNGDVKQAQEYADDLLREIKYSIRNGIDLQHFDVAFAVENMKACIPEEDADDYPELDDLAELPQWVHERHSDIRYFIRLSYLWKYNNNNDYKKFLGWAYCFVIDLYKRLPNNYITTSLYARSVICTSDLLDHFDIQTLLDLYDDLNCYYEDEAIEECIEILLSLHQHNPSEYNLDYLRERYEQDELDYPFDSVNDDGIALLCILKDLLNEDFCADVKEIEDESDVHRLLRSLMLRGRNDIVEKIISSLGINETTQSLESELHDIYQNHRKLKLKHEYEKLIGNSRSIDDCLQFIKDVEGNSALDTYSSTLIMELYMHIGKQYMQLGEYEEAYNYMLKSVSISSSRSPLFALREEFFWHLNRMLDFSNVINFFVVDADEFLLNHYNGILDLISQSPYQNDGPIRNKRNQTLCNICKILIKRKDFTGTEEMIDKLSVSDGTKKRIEGSYDVLGDVLCIEGELYFNRNNYTSSFESFNKAAEFYRMVLDNDNSDCEILHKLIRCQYWIIRLYQIFQIKQTHEIVFDICDNALESCDYILKNDTHNPFYNLDTLQILTLKVIYYLGLDNKEKALETAKLFYDTCRKNSSNCDFKVIWNELKDCFRAIHDGFFHRGLRDEIIVISSEELKLKDYLVIQHFMSVQGVDFHSTGASILALGSENNALYRETKDFLNNLMGIDNDDDIKIIPAKLPRSPEDRMMEQASSYRILDAMVTCCEILGVEMPTDISDTKKLKKRFPDHFKDDNLMGFVVNAYLSTRYEHANDIEKAESYADEALIIAQRMGEKMNICGGHIYWAKAVMYYNAKLYEKAKEAGAKALEIFEKEHVAYSDLPDLYILVGKVCEKQKAYSEAVSYYNPALEIMKKSKCYESSRIEQFSQHINQILNKC